MVLSPLLALTRHGAGAMLIHMATDTVWIEAYLDRHASLVAFECEERGVSAVVAELTDILGVSRRSVVRAMHERMFVVPVSLNLLEAV